MRGRWIGVAKTDEVEVEFDLSPTNIKFVTETPHQSPLATASPQQGKPFDGDVT